MVAPGSDAEKTIKGHHDACQKRLDTVGRNNMNVHDGMCERILSSILESTVQTYVSSLLQFYKLNKICCDQCRRHEVVYKYL